ncbi:restriction endonuclease [Shewanella psychropiezotolerans]|uniref:Restriction endonuclease n=2 Tax=Shewanella psychropiezotolerans TaxID=2593655 RepID=A0ABX5X5V9_9GAMM|nr:restriction endonuclease [Shewanella psychropiezotolerans]
MLEQPLNNIPSYQSLMKPVLIALKDGDLLNIPQIYERVVNELSLAEELVNLRIPSGRATYIRSRIGWSKTYLVKAKLIEQPKRGHCIITQRGLDALGSNRLIDNQYLNQFSEFISFKMNSDDVTQVSSNAVAKEIDSFNELPPLEQIDNAFQSLNASLADEVLEAILAASPKFFEQLVVDLMVAMGYGGSRKDAGQATQYTQDGGIDGIIKEDKLGLEMIYLQAKRYQASNTVGRPDIQAFAGALDMHRAKKGVFITTSRFSKEAQDFVSLIEKKIVLIDGKQLTELMIEHSLGVTVKQTYTIKAVDSDYFIED